MKKNSKKRLLPIIFAVLLILGLLVGLIQPLFAAEVMPDEGTASPSLVSELDTENTGILPTSPFYFLKEFGRRVGRAFTFNSVSKVEYELSVGKMKAAELQKIKELDPKNSKAIKTAVDNYNSSVVRLRSSLDKVRSIANDTKLESILSEVATSAVKHKDFLESLEKGHPEIKDKLQEAEKSTEDVLLILPQRLESVIFTPSR